MRLTGRLSEKLGVLAKDLQGFPNGRRLTDELPETFRLGMVTFADMAEVQAPPTTDRAPVRGALDRLRADPAGDPLARHPTDAHPGVAGKKEAQAEAEKARKTLAEVERLYPNGGYVDCLGRERCRGTVVAIWRPETTTG